MECRTNDRWRSHARTGDTARVLPRRKHPAEAIAVGFGSAVKESDRPAAAGAAATTRVTYLIDLFLVHFGRHAVIYTFLCCSVIYLLTGAYHVQSIDVGAAEEPAWALATHHSLNLAGVPHHQIPWYFNHGGGIYSDRFPGAILYLAPGYWIANLLGLHAFSFVPGVATAALVAAASATIMNRVFVRIFELRAATVATLFFAFGTGTWSVAANAPWSHTLDQLVIALTLYALAAGRFRIAMLVVGFVIPVRPVLAISVGTLGVMLAWQRRSLRFLIESAVLALPGLFVLIAYNHAIFGRWSISNGHELGGRIGAHYGDLPINVIGTLFSPTRGALFFYPILILLPFTFRAAWRAAAGWERAAAVAGLLGLACQLLINRYSGGDTFFGSRLLIEPLTLAAPIIARSVYLCARSRTDRLVSMLLGFGLLIHLFGAIAS